MLVCKSKSKTMVEYALNDINKPIGISEYEISGVLPDEYKSSLPSIEEIEAEGDGIMSTPDEEIALKVSEKLEQTNKWSKKTIDKIALYLKEGNATSIDIISLIENQRPENNEVAE
jgi:hypothetical protein